MTVKEIMERFNSMIENGFIKEDDEMIIMGKGEIHELRGIGLPKVKIEGSKDTGFYSIGFVGK